MSFSFADFSAYSAGGRSTTTKTSSSTPLNLSTRLDGCTSLLLFILCVYFLFLETSAYILVIANLVVINYLADAIANFDVVCSTEEQS